MSNNIKYLPLSRGHIVPISGLSPEDIKRSSNQVIRDREPVSHTTTLNAISSAFGCKGGFSNYDNFYSQKLLPFLKENKLYKHTDLLKNSGFIGLKSWQDLSERLFFSNLPIFEKVYISNSVPYEFDTIDATTWFSKLSQVKSGLNQKLCEFYKYRSCGRLKELSALTDESSLVVESEFSIQEIRKEILSLYHVDLLFSIGLLDDTLCLPNSLPPEPLYYTPNDYPNGEKEIEFLSEIHKLYSLYIYEKKENWHTVIPFNEKLIFIANSKGEYDFIFKNQRDKLFKHKDKNTGKFIKELPSAMKNDYLFDRWLYFEYKGWRELDRHKAEQYFYKNGGQACGWTSDICQQYYIANNIYRQKKYALSSSLPFFTEVAIDKKKLMISDLVTIQDLNAFLDRKPDYLKTRDPLFDSLLASNLDSDISLPASLTWFDVLSYIKDMEDRFNISFRLLSLQEFLTLRKRGSAEKNYPHWKEKYHIDEFRNWYDSFRPIYKLHGEAFNKGNYINPSVFNKDVENYFNGIELDQTTDNLTFVTSPFFAEWLIGNTCVRSADLSSFAYGSTVWISRDTVPKHSNGKYKDLKIGFRLCYEV